MIDIAILKIPVTWIVVDIKLVYICDKTSIIYAQPYLECISTSFSWNHFKFL